LSPVTRDIEVARRWFASAGKALDGIIAKRIDLEYLSDERAGMLKVKQQQTADCIIGGLRYASHGRVVGSLLLGLYDKEGRLNHIGFTSNIPREQKEALTRKLEKLIQLPGFTGNAPGKPRRWSTKRSTQWEPLRPTLVAEVQYDYFAGGRFRHGAKILPGDPTRCQSNAH
jgi:ATP-dependent DNA ligase